MTENVSNELRNLDWREIKTRTEAFATSEAGRAEIRNLGPFANSQLAQASVEQTLACKGILVGGARPHMESLDLFATWHSRLRKQAVLKPLELKDVRHFCFEALALTETLQPYEFGWLRDIRAGMMNAEEPLSAIDQILTGDGDIRGDASETIYQLTQEKQNQTRQLQNSLERLAKSYELETVLQERYVTTRDGRWVLPVKSGRRHNLEGIIHGASQTKQTVYMEPQEVVPLNNRIRQIDVQIEEEIERLLSDLSKYLFTLADAFESARQTMLDFDVLLAKAQLAQALDAKAFEFTDGVFELNDLKHPLLLLNKNKVAGNTVTLNADERVLLLSGPNAGGKTVLLKAIGLAAQMARSGLPIAAEEGSKLPFFQNIVTAIGDEQSVDANLSTFAAHLKALNHACDFKGPESLILIDEICGSTDPEEGSALARGFIEKYAAQGAYAVITSHLGALKTGWDSGSGVLHGSLEFDKAKGPTYLLIRGIPGQSMALLTAKRVGVRTDVLDRAVSLLSPEMRQHQKNLEEVETLKEKLRELHADMEVQKKQAQKVKARHEEALRRLEVEKNQILKSTARKAEKKVDALLQEVRVKDIFKKHGEENKIKFDLPEIITASDVTTAGGATAPTTADEFAKLYPPGSKVLIVTLGQDGIIQGHPNNRGEIPVLSRSMRLTIPWQDLRPPDQPRNPTRDILRKTGHFAYAPKDEDRTIDVRGLSADDAIAKLEIALDQAATHSEDRVKIIHGHGTDTLKRAVRGYLSRSLYIKKWQAGTAETGGDGITWAEIG